MAKASGSMSDKFPQFMSLNVVQTAANTLTFAKLSVGVSIFDYSAFIINRIEYHIPVGTFDLVVADADSLEMGITGSGTIADLATSQSQVYDSAILVASEQGASANFIVQTLPIIHDFSSLPGGGLLVPTGDMWAACDSAGLTGAASFTARVYYQIMALKAEDYIELAQRLRVLTT